MNLFDEIGKAASYAGGEIAKNAGYVGNEIGKNAGYAAKQAANTAGYIASGTVSNVVKLSDLKDSCTGYIADKANETGKMVVYKAEEATNLIDKDLAKTALTSAVQAGAGAAATVAVNALAGIAIGATLPVSTLAVATTILIGAYAANQAISKES